MITILHYPTCNTSKSAIKFLQKNNVPFTLRHIAQEAPTTDELRAWHTRSGLPLKKFFNTSGKAYREGNVKDRLPALDQEGQLALLATDGLLVKRPILVADDVVLVGFHESVWQEILAKANLLPCEEI